MKNTQLYFLMLVLFLAANIYAQEKVIKLWDGPAPGTETRENKEHWDDSKRVYEVYQPDLTIFLPENYSEKTPALIICPGGAFRRIVMEKEGYKVARWLNENGIAGFVLKYRLQFDEALQDIQRALSYVRYKSDEFNVDPDKIGVIGFSAGGHVVGNLSTHYIKSEMKDAIDSVSCYPNFMIGIYPYIEPRDTTRSHYSYFTPFHECVDKNTPPAFLVHAMDDTSVLVENSINYFSALKKYGVPVELHLYGYGKHGFALEEDRGPVLSWASLCIDWLKESGILVKE